MRDKTFASSGGRCAQVKAKALRLVIKICHFLPAVALEDLLRGVPISSFAAGLLASRDPPTQASAVPWSVYIESYSL